MDALAEEGFGERNKVCFGADVGVVDGIKINESDLRRWNVAGDKLVVNLFEEARFASTTNTGNDLDEGLIDIRD